MEFKCPICSLPLIQSELQGFFDCRLCMGSFSKLILSSEEVTEKIELIGTDVNCTCPTLLNGHYEGCAYAPNKR